MTDILFTVICILAGFVALGFALAPLMVVSGLWAYFSAKAHAKEVEEIERLLSED